MYLQIVTFTTSKLLLNVTLCMLKLFSCFQRKTFRGRKKCSYRGLEFPLGETQGRATFVRLFWLLCDFFSRVRPDMHFIDFYTFLMIFDDFRRFPFNIIALYMKIEPGWWRMSPGYIWEQFPSREPPRRPHFESQNHQFLTFRLHFWKCRFWLFVPNSLFESRIPQSTLYKMFLGTIGTILGFTFV